MAEYTENNSLTFYSTKDPRLDFFFHAIEGASPERTTELLEKSWAQSPLDTMKLVFNLRDIRNGKGIRPQSLICLRWLYQNQFENLMLNLENFEHFGCWKDYPNLLLIALFYDLPYDYDIAPEKFPEGPKKPKITKYDRIIIKSFPKEKRRELENTKTVCRQVELKYRKDKNSKWIKEKITDHEIEEKFEKFDYKSKEKYFEKEKLKDKFYFKFKTNKAKLRKLNEYRREYFQKKFEEDIKLKQLYDRIVDLFAKQLFQDYLNYNEQHYEFISLAAKWIPNHGTYFDKYLFIVSSVSNKFFQLMKQSTESSTKTNSIDVDQMLKDEKLAIFKFSKICTQLRKQIKVPEIYMSSNDWNKLDYKCVPSKAMLRYRQAFINHDFERFNQFISSKSLKAGTLTPADLVKQLMDSQLFNEMLEPRKEIPETMTEQQITSLKAIENQWKSLIDQFKSSGSLMCKDTLAICDTSGSMTWVENSMKPIHAAIGLTLFLLELNNSAWNNCVVTFSEKPTFHKIDPKKSFIERVKQLLSAPFGMNTDLNLVFENILKRAKDKKLTEEQMPKLLFIFSDMEFDQAQKEKTNFEVFQEQYKNHGYKLPFVVFWNLQGGKNKSTPVQFQQDGVILLSGYSAQTFKFLFNIKDITELTPIMMLIRILSDPRYDCVKIIGKDDNCLNAENIKSILQGFKNFFKI